MPARSITWQFAQKKGKWWAKATIPCRYCQKRISGEAFIPSRDEPSAASIAMANNLEAHERRCIKG